MDASAFFKGSLGISPLCIVADTVGNNADAVGNIADGVENTVDGVGNQFLPSLAPERSYEISLYIPNERDFSYLRGFIILMY